MWSGIKKKEKKRCVAVCQEEFGVGGEEVRKTRKISKKRKEIIEY